MSIFEVALESFIDMNHELVLLSKQIDWEALESEFAEYYCADNGRPSVPIRKMVGDITRKMNERQLSLYGKDLELFVRVINQERNDKDKVYSLDEPDVQCISKGKEHKKYEFGNKSAIAKTRSGLIVSALAFKGNPYDGHPVSAHMEQTRRLTGYTPEEAVTDRGYRGKKEVGRTKINIPTSGTPGQNYYQKTKARKKFQKRAGIEPVIGHLKSDHRMMRNFLKGTRGDVINTLMAAAAYNMGHWMNKNALSSFVSWLKTVIKGLENVIFGNENQYAYQYLTLATVAKSGVWQA